MKKAIVFACSLLMTASIAHAQDSRIAATLLDIEGSILVNQGEQFVTGANNLGLSSGDRVMALEASSALLRYEDGCDVKVDPETIVTLSEVSPCAGGLLAVEQLGAGGLALGAGAPAASSGISPWLMGAAVVVGSGLIYEEFFDGRSSP